MINLKAFFLSQLLLAFFTNCSSQDSLCFDQIDKYVRDAEGLPCKRLDTGVVKGISPFQFRDCYKIDSSGRVAVVETSVGQSVSKFVRFFFIDNSLVKVETGEFKRGKKINTQSLYYTSDKCQFVNPYQNYDLNKMYYLRLATLYLDRLKEADP